MIQVLGLRTFITDEGKDKKYDKLFDVQAKSVKDLFSSIDRVLAALPSAEKWNCFYTVANCGPGKREFISSSVLAFDLDKMEHKYQDNYIEVTCAVLQLERPQVGIVDSGNGLHFLVNLKHQIKKSDFYKENRHHYKAICFKLNKALEKAGIPGEFDSTVFEPRRILRLPGTVNRKPDRPEKRCSLLQPLGNAQLFDFEALSGLPTIKATDQLSKAMIRKYPRTDPPAVLEGCSFLRFCREKPEQISEPQWYAALSITSRLEDPQGGKDGRDYSHELSAAYSGYDADETEQKIEQSLESSGPRTCESIGGLWGGCKACPNYQKVSSPILIRGASTIGTEFTGFHNISWTGKGNPSPNFEDLRKFFLRDNPYLGLDGSGMVQVWRGTHYQHYERLFLKEFAQTHFDPQAKENMRLEFANLVASTRLKKIDWWGETVKRKMNFLNGYLNIDDMDFRPHDTEMGFRYVLPYEYDHTAKAPTFDKMLDMVTGGHQSARDLLLEFLGYCLSNDDCWAQKALVLVGDGANGKSTFVNVLKELAGEGNHASFNMVDLNSSEYNRQLLDGKLFNISEETPNKAMSDNSLFKSLTTGGEIQVRSPYKEPYFVRNTAKLIFSCNDLPGSPDNSYGYYRRLIIVPFNQTFTPDTRGYDPHIHKKLTAELPGIFNLAMQGYKRLVANKAFTACDSSQKQLELYQLENDTVLWWAKESLVLHNNGGFAEHFAPIRDLYESYRFDTERQGHKPVTFQKFAKSLRKAVDGYEGRYRAARVQRGQESVLTRGLQGISYQNYS